MPLTTPCHAYHPSHHLSFPPPCSTPSDYQKRFCRQVMAKFTYPKEGTDTDWDEGSPSSGSTHGSASHGSASPAQRGDAVPPNESFLGAPSVSSDGDVLLNIGGVPLYECRAEKVQASPSHL